MGKNYTTMKENNLFTTYYNKKKDATIYRIKDNKKIFGFIGRNIYGFFYAFGSPSQNGGYIAFNKKSYADCERCLIENI